MAKIALCGITTNKNFSKNGEAKMVAKISAELRRQGHIIDRFDVTDNINMSFGISKLVYDKNYAYKEYLRTLRKFDPDICLTFTDFDSSSIVAAKEIGAKTVLFYNMHNLVCPLWNALDWKSDYCHTPGIARCLLHTVMAYNNQHITGPMNQVSGRMFNLIKLASYFGNYKISKLADLYIVPSKGMFNELISFGINRKNISLIRYGIDISEWKPSRTKPKNKNILFYSFPSPEKGVNYFIELAKRFYDDGKNNLKFIMLKSSHKDIPPNVTQVEWINEQDKLIKLVQSAYAVIVPSVWEDPSPLVCVESMAAGKPVIGFDVMGLREQIVDKKTGFIVKKGDLEMLYLKIKELAEDENLANTMGIAGRKRVIEYFNSSKTHEKYSETINKLIKS